MVNFKMDWEFERADDGNIALIGEIDLSQGMEFTLGVGFGRSRQSASAHLLQSLATPFADQREKYVSQWQRARATIDLSAHTKDGGSLARLSQCLLLAHEDKTFQGAFVASLSIPWGDTQDDSDPGGYHQVWTRDMVQVATALLACEQTESPLRALIWLACVQAADGSVPQNSSISGEDGTLFAGQDGVEAAWAVVQPICGKVTPVHVYEPGTWGPSEIGKLTNVWAVEDAAKGLEIKSYASSRARVSA
jgi:glucoamylase